MHRPGPATALIVVDMQNDFADPDGSLYVAGGEALVGPINAEIVRGVAGGSPIVYTQDWHPEQTPHFEKDGGIWPVHCVAGSWGARLHPRLLVAGPTIRKGSGGEDGYSGFTARDPATGVVTPTALEALLRSLGVTDIEVCGLALDYCVGETAADGARLGFTTTLQVALTEAVELSDGDGRAMIQRLRESGVSVPPG